MPNTLALRFDRNTGRIWIAIDGRERFEFSEECLLDSILARVPSTTGNFSMHRTSDAERIISFGYCDEYCCPSVTATVAFSEDKVSWTRFRHSDAPEDAAGYEFNRDGYEAEINRVLLELLEFSNQEIQRVSEELRAKSNPRPDPA